MDDIKEKQNKVLATLSSEYGEYYEAGNDKRSHELSCIKEEDHVKQNEIKTSKENLDVNEDSQSSINISNNSDRNYSRLPSIYFKRTERNDHDSTLTNESIKFAVQKQNNETINNTGFTLSGTTIVDNSFSFTINSSDTGDFIIKIVKNKPEKEANLNINSTLKSESVGVRRSLLTTKPINSVNMQEKGDNSNRIEHSLLNRKEDRKQVSSTFKSINKSNKQQQSLITSTPAKIMSTSSSKDSNTDQKDENQLFNHDSFLSSIPERGDNDIETSINIFEINTLDGGDEMVYHSLYTSVLIEK